MSTPFRAACLQITPGNDLEANLGQLEGLIAAAASDGAVLVALPEFATYLDRDSRSMRSSATGEDESEALSRLRAAAKRHAVWIVVGSLVMLADDDANGKLANRSFLIAPDGTVAARYDKIHLFDAKLPDGRLVGESRHYRGGDQAVVIDTPIGRIGLSVCYDLRFPQLYRALALAGADILMVPAAFTAQTGAAHWEPLLRARAIETGCYVLAPATTGASPGDWHTYGHAMIIDPWGKVIADAGAEAGVFCSASIDPTLCSEMRTRIPSLTSNPDFEVAITRVVDA